MKNKLLILMVLTITGSIVALNPAVVRSREVNPLFQTQINELENERPKFHSQEYRDMINGISLDKDGKSALIVAFESGKDKAFNHLLQAGANVNVADREGRTILMLVAAAGKDNTSINDLARARVNAADRFSYAGAQLVDKILNMGAQVNAQDNKGYTALMYAVSKGNPNIVERLLQDRNINVNATSKDSNTALKLAQERGYKSLEKALKNAGAR
jgi:hypothetical protein